MDMTEQQLFQEISQIIEESKAAVAVNVNVEMTTRNWRIGKLIQQTILKGERSDYGKQMVGNIAKQLSLKFGKTWNDKMLWHCSKFFTAFPDEQILSAVRREFTWTHLKTVTYIPDPLKREFYLEMCKLGRWSTRTLQERLSSGMLQTTFCYLT